VWVEALAALAAAAGGAVAQAAGTDAWNGARRLVRQLLGRGGNARAQVVPTRPSSPDPHRGEDGASYDVFVAYGGGDAAWVRSFAGWLSARGVRVAYDELLARPGGVRVHTLESAIRDAAHGLLVFSPDVWDDGWVRQEYAALMRRSIEDEAQRFIPVLVGDPGTPLELPEFAGVLYPADFRGADEVTYEHLCDQIIRVVREDPA
jgi:TIR domain